MNTERARAPDDPEGSSVGKTEEIDTLRDAGRETDLRGLRRMRLFLSHASLDQHVAEDVAGRIRLTGFDVWMAEREVHGGQDFAEEIMRGLDECDGFVLLLTPNANNSPHVKNEVNQAVGRKLPILPLLLERFDVSSGFAYYLSHVQWVDVSGGLDQCWGAVAGVLADWRNGRWPEHRKPRLTPPRPPTRGPNALDSLGRGMATVRNMPIRRVDIFGAVVLATAGMALPIICGGLLRAVNKALIAAGGSDTRPLGWPWLYWSATTTFVLGTGAMAVGCFLLGVRPALATGTSYFMIAVPPMIVASAGFAAFSWWLCAEASRVKQVRYDIENRQVGGANAVSPPELSLRTVKAQAVTAVLFPLSCVALLVAVRLLLRLFRTQALPSTLVIWVGLILGIIGCLHLALTGSTADLLTEVIWPEDNRYSLRDYVRDQAKRSPAHWFNIHFTWPCIYLGIILCLVAVWGWLAEIWEV